VQLIDARGPALETSVTIWRASAYDPRAAKKVITSPCIHGIFRNRLAAIRGGELIFAHLGGMPVEETLGVLAPVAVSLGVAMRMTMHRLRRGVRRSRPDR
jgi:hypothetical protein